MKSFRCRSVNYPGLEIDKLLEELDALHAKIKELTDILADDNKVHDILAR